MKSTQYKKKRAYVFAKRNKQIEERVIDLNLQHTKDVLALEAKLVERAAKAAQYKKERVAVFVEKNKQVEERMKVLITQKNMYVLVINAKIVEKEMKSTQYKKKRVYVFAKRNKQKEEKVTNLNLQKTEDTLALEHKLVEKATKAAQYKKEKVVDFAKRNKQRKEQIIQKKELNQLYIGQLRIKVDRKIEAIVLRKNRFTTKTIELLRKRAVRVETIKKTNLDKIRCLEVKITSKLDAVTGRKIQTLSEICINVASGIKQKEKRTLVLKSSKEAGLLLARMKLKNKLIKGNMLKENSFFRRQVMSAERNNAKSERTKKQLKQRVFNERKLQYKHENRRMGIMQRKERLQEKENKKNKMISIRRNTVLENHIMKEDDSIQKVKEKTSAQIKEATARRASHILRKIEHAKTIGNSIFFVMCAMLTSTFKNSNFLQS